MIANLKRGMVIRVQENSKKLRICFTSDLHGYFYPTSYGDTQEKDMGLFRCFPNFKKDENTLIIDGGDILQGSAFAYYCKQELGSNHMISEIMNACGYDYVTVGNHDFNYGIPYLEEYTNNLDAKCVCQNVMDSQGNPKYPYDIKVMPNGLRIGVIGIVTDFVNVWEKEENLVGVQVIDPYTCAKKALEECKDKADVTIGIYHGGFENDLSTGKLLSESSENIAYKICQELDFDVLLTGHQHMSIDGQTINGTYIVQSSEYGKEFQALEITYCDGTLDITSNRTVADAKPDEALCRQFKEIEDKVQEWLEQPIGRINKALMPEDKVTMAYQGSSIADFINQVQLYFSKAQISSVGLANEIAGFNSEVKTRDIIATYPYPNTLLVLEITGKDLKAAMERSAEYFDVLEDGTLTVSDRFLSPKEEHYNYDYYAGVDYVIKPSNPLGERIVKLQYQGNDVKPDDTYTICINNYRASGAGGYPMYPNCKVVKEINIEMVELIMEYFQTFDLITV